jgi:predicted metal-dependent enzyme (double-stranded beta helix superfamily)
MFELDQFIADCRAAVTADKSHKNVRELVARAVSDQAAILKELCEPKRAAIQKLYHSSDLTILNVVWAPRLTFVPHNHQMWAVIGIYTGREDNIFWRRVPGGQEGKLEAVGAKALCEKDAEPLGGNVIHSVTNPIDRLTGAIHVYGGDFFGAERSEWNPETLTEGRYDVAKTLRMCSTKQTHFTEQDDAVDRQRGPIISRQIPPALCSQPTHGTMSARSHSRPGRARAKSGHVRNASKAEVV